MQTIKFFSLSNTRNEVKEKIEVDISKIIDWFNHKLLTIKPFLPINSNTNCLQNNAFYIREENKSIFCIFTTHILLILVYLFLQCFRKIWNFYHCWFSSTPHTPALILPSVPLSDFSLLLWLICYREKTMEIRLQL